jgi:YVTN family beta-propeller protein
VGGAPTRLAVDGRAGPVYATDYAAGTLAVIDAARAAVVATVPVGRRPTDVAADSATGRVFVADGGAGTVAVLDGDGTPLATLRAGAAPFVLASDPAGGRLYAVAFGDNSVWRIEDRRLRGPVARLVAVANVRQSPADGDPTGGIGGG